MEKKIAVLGGGAGGHAMAADLTLKGMEVRWCEAPEFAEKFKVALEHQEIELDDLRDPENRQKVVKIYKVTTSFEDAMKNADYIMIAIPALGHRLFFTSMIPYLEDGQAVVIYPGNFGALLLANMLRGKGMAKDVVLAETSTMPYGCRVMAPGKVHISVDAQKMCIASFPAKNSNKIFNDLKLLYPLLEPCDNVMASTLSNPNFPVHPLGSVINVGAIETLKNDFYLYKMGLTPSGLRTVKAVYDEIEKLSKAIGVRVTQYTESTFRDQATIMGAAFDRDLAIEEASGPSSMESRYISEDVPCGLVPTALLAHQFNVPTPIINSIIELASVMNKRDYRKEGTSLEELGIAGLSKDELAKVLQEGWPAT